MRNNRMVRMADASNHWNTVTCFEVSSIKYYLTKLNSQTRNDIMDRNNPKVPKVMASKCCPKWLRDRELKTTQGRRGSAETHGNAKTELKPVNTPPDFRHS